MSDMDKIIKEVMRDDGLIHAREGNLKSMQHATKRRNIKFRVKIRRDYGEVKPSAEQIDGKEYLFSFGWVMEGDERYPNETVWIPNYLQDYPEDAPAWIASGDLEEVSETSHKARETELTYAEVQESQLKHNQELFEPQSGLPKEDIEYIKECLDAAIVTARRNSIINKDKNTGKYYEEDERKLLDVMDRFCKHFGGER